LCAKFDGIEKRIGIDTAMNTAKRHVKRRDTLPLVQSKQIVTAEIVQSAKSTLNVKIMLAITLNVRYFRITKGKQPTERRAGCKLAGTLSIKILWKQ